MTKVVFKNKLQITEIFISNNRFKGCLISMTRIHNFPICTIQYPAFVITYAVNELKI